VSFFVIQVDQQSQVILAFVGKDFQACFHRALINARCPDEIVGAIKMDLSLGIEIGRFCSLGKSTEQLQFASSGANSAVLYLLHYVQK